MVVTQCDLQQFLSPQAEHILDWFHITMRLTVMKQLAKSVSIENVDVERQLDRIKWCLWHGNLYKANYLAIFCVVI